MNTRVLPEKHIEDSNYKDKTTISWQNMALIAEKLP